MSTTINNRQRREYGDWQTNNEFANSICKYLKEEGVNPQVIIEPTCGVGNFIVAAINVFENIEDIYGIEINAEYLNTLRGRLNECHGELPKVHLLNENIFNVDFNKIKALIRGKNILVLGNPPWVTNSDLGAYESNNIPIKANFKHVKGLDAITGKGNFDIAEYVTSQMIELINGEKASLAFIIKNSVIKNIVYDQKNTARHIVDIKQLSINALKEFGASVSASLLTLKSDSNGSRECRKYNFYSKKYIKTFGWIGNNFVSDSTKYKATKEIDGKSFLVWRSGLKHDCSKVMELSLKDGKYYNNLNELVDIEDDLVYPFLKSSDVKDEHIKECRKYVILTQHRTNEDTSYIKEKYPKTYKYLSDHAEYFKARKSSIYKGRPEFCLFGIGDYSFKKYKIVISGLYKQTRFSLVSTIDGKPVLVDDTTYQLGFDDILYAETTLRILNSPLVQEFVQSICFEDAKRPINKDLLMRIDLAESAEKLGQGFLGLSDSEYTDYLRYVQPVKELSLFA